MGNERLRGRGISAFSLHPGMIPTDLSRHLNAEAMQEMRLLTKQLAAEAKPTSKPRPKPEFKTVQSGAATQIWAATAPELQGQGGAYCSDCQVSEAKHWAVDTHAVSELWTVSEQLLNCKWPEQMGAKL